MFPGNVWLCRISGRKSVTKFRANPSARHKPTGVFRIFSRIAGSLKGNSSSACLSESRATTWPRAAMLSASEIVCLSAPPTPREVTIYKMRNGRQPVERLDEKCRD